MKSIQNQYNDLKEGKMSQANFIRNIRMTFPQYVTNVTSLNDSIKILKNKGILSESFTTFQPEEETMGEMNMDVKPEESNDAEFDAILKQLEDEMAGEIAVKSDVLDEPLEEDEQLNEGKGKELHPNAIHPGELRMGIRVEMEHTDDMDKAKKIALDHLAENPFYYTALKLSGIESPSAPKVKAPKEVKTKKAKDATELVDKANQMQKVKMPKTEEKKKLKEELENEATMRFQDLPADPEKYKIVRDSKNYIIKATNADGVEFQRGDVTKAYDGEEVKIADFKEEQGKVKALYNKGMFFASIDIDGLKAPKATMRPGVNMGGSFEKFKSKLTEIVREILAEETPSKKTTASEITAKAVEYINDYNEGEKTYKKSQLENVFDSYEDKVGRRFDDSVFEDVIDMLKAKGYTMGMKETFDDSDAEEIDDMAMVMDERNNLDPKNKK
jgi:hypothetical protein